MNKKQIRLTESDLHRIVKESLLKILEENSTYVYRGVTLPSWMGQQWTELIDQAIDFNKWPVEKVQLAINRIKCPSNQL